MIKTVRTVLNKFDRIDKNEIRKFSLIKATFLKYLLVRFTIIKFGTAKLRKPNQNRNFLAIFSSLLPDMDLRNRISSFAELGSLFPGLIKSDLMDQAFSANNWFTRSETARALNSWSSLLTADNLTRWTDLYPIPAVPPVRNILVITAGNIPLVGFHDFLSVLISGHRFIGKLSSRDDQLLTLLAKELIRMEPLFADQIQLQNFAISPDAVIATGSNNSSRYFQMEYGHVPHIIRKNRSSAAILDGSETDEELDNLAADILEYYGLGCRSVSHLFLPAGYSPGNLVEPLISFNQIDPCEPFNDNLRYQRARLAMLNTPFIDARQVLLIESEMLHSPIGVVHYSFYDDLSVLLSHLKAQDTEIQCLVGHKSANPNLIPFGSAQKPELWDYADNIDTLDFIINL
ncbi:MAG: acyl-CoA reductase [Bacteroidales bacterium]